MINYLEFTTAAMQKDLAIKHEYLKATFEMFDQDKNNFIEVEELKQLFQGSFDEYNCAEVGNSMVTASQTTGVGA